jgi:hypothetical protein
MNIDTKEGMEAACDWQRRFLTLCAPQFTWAVPRSMSIYMIDQTAKTIRAETPRRDRGIERVFVELGYEVL